MMGEHRSRRFSPIASRLVLATAVGLGLVLTVGLCMSASQVLADPPTATGMALPAHLASSMVWPVQELVPDLPARVAAVTHASQPRLRQKASSSLSTSPDWTLNGQANGDFFGYSVAGAGDMNGDGYADLVVGAYGVPSPTNRGTAYVYLGDGSGIGSTPPITLSDPDQADGDRFGFSVAGAGDVNGDGYADLVVGAYGVPGGVSRGAAYVYLGSSGPIATSPAFTLTHPNQADGDLLGVSVAGAGDVNGDGYADLIIGAYGAGGSFQGAAYVYLGGGGTISNTPVVTLSGQSDWDYFGYSVAGAGDLNGDGYTDLVVGAFGAAGGDNRGASYVYLGSGSTIANTPAFTLTGQANDDYFGRSVAGAGDVNGDGYSDLVIGAWGAPGGFKRGAAYVYLGSGGTIASSPAITLTDPGQAGHDYFGISVDAES